MWVILKRTINWHHAFYSDDMNGISDFTVDVYHYSDKQKALEKAHKLAPEQPFSRLGRYTMKDRTLTKMVEIWCKEMEEGDCISMEYTS